MTLLGTQKEEFNREGYLIIRDLLTHEEVHVIKWRADQIASGETKHVPEDVIERESSIGEDSPADTSRKQPVSKMSNLVPHDGIMRAHATNPNIVGVVASLIGANIKLYADRFFMKLSGQGPGTRYHQDSYSWKEIVPHNLVSCWAALDHTTIENGCLLVIPRTHKCGLLGESKRKDIEQRAHSGKLGVHEVAVELHPGDCTFHHSLLLYRTNGVPRSLNRCRGYATHYMSAKSRYLGRRDKPNYMLVRGRAFPGCI